MLGRSELREAFEKVDKDNSGSIDLAELAGLCGSLNYQVNQADVTALFNEIDTNHDGKVSFEEFVAWFRLGKSTKLKGFLKQSLRGMAFVDKHKSRMTHTANGDNETLNLFNLEISEGQPGNKTTFGVHFCCTAPDMLTRVANACPDFSGNEEARVWSIMIMKAKNPAALKEAIETFIQFGKDTATEMDEGLGQMVDMTSYQVGIDGDYVVVAVDLLANPMAEAQLQMAQQLAGTVPLESFGLSAEFMLRSDCSLKHLMTVDDLWDHSENSGVFANLSCSKSGKAFWAEFIQQSPGYEYVDTADQEREISFVKSLNGISFVARTNGNTEGNGSAYKNANQALQAYNQGYAGQQHGVQMLEQLQSVSKSYPQLLETLQSSKDSEADEMLAQIRIPAAQDLLFAFRDHGLHDWTTAMVFNNFVAKVTTTGEGMAEIFQDVWNVAYPEA
jgi:hypothetical protein